MSVYDDLDDPDHSSNQIDYRKIRLLRRRLSALTVVTVILFALDMSCSTSLAHISCNEPTAEWTRKIKEFSSRKLEPIGSFRPIMEVESRPWSKYGSSSKRNGGKKRSTSPRPESRTSPPRREAPIEVIDSSATDKCSLSPQRKGLKGSFPFPAVVALTNESKISAPFKVEDFDNASRLNIKFPLRDEKPALTDVISVGSSSRVDILTNSLVEEPSPESHGRRGPVRSRRARGTLLSQAPKSPSPKITTPQVSVHKTTFPQNSFCTPEGPQTESNNTDNELPPGPTKLVEADIFRIESALDYQITDSEDPRLEDEFTGLRCELSLQRASMRVKNERDWSNLQLLWANPIGEGSNHVADENA